MPDELLGVPTSLLETGVEGSASGLLPLEGLSISPEGWLTTLLPLDPLGVLMSVLLGSCLGSMSVVLLEGVELISPEGLGVLCSPELEDGVPVLMSVTFGWLGPKSGSWLGTERSVVLSNSPEGLLIT